MIYFELKLRVIPILNLLFIVLIVDYILAVRRFLFFLCVYVVIIKVIFRFFD